MFLNTQKTLLDWTTFLGRTMNGVKNVFHRVAIWRVMLLLLSAYLCIVAAYIEHVNKRAGYLLPRTSASGTAVKKWRVIARSLIDQELERIQRLRLEGGSVTQNIDQQEMEWKKYSAENKLRSLVMKYGVFQLPLGMACLLFGAFTAFNVDGRIWERALGLVAIAAGALAVIASFARDYLGSLGL